MIPEPTVRHTASRLARGLAVALAVAAAAPALALDPNRKVTDYIVDFWQEDSGLPQKHVDVVYQTRDGYLWLGTRGGLARFDGVRFTTFDDRLPDQLPESEVRAIAEDAEGGLWIGTYGGGVSHLKNGRFRTYSKRDGLPGDFIRSIACGKDGAVWIGTEVGLARLHEGRMQTYTPRDGLPSERIWSLYTAADGTVWIGTYRGLASIAPDGSLVNHAERHPESVKDAVHSIAGDGHGGLWVATGHNGLFQFTDRPLRRVSTEDGLESNHIDTVTVDPQGTVWMGSLGQLYRYRGERAERFFGLITKVSGNRTLQVSSLRSIESVFADREGSVWVGTGSDGVARLRDAVFSMVSLERDGQERRAASVFVDSRGTVWTGIGQSGGLSTIRDGVQADAGIASTVDTIFEDRDGAIWIEEENRLLRSPGGTGRFVPVAMKGQWPDATADLNVIASLVARDGSFWLGDRNLGLFHHRDGVMTHYEKEDGLPGVQVRALAEDGAGGLWVGTRDGGLVRLLDGKPAATYSVAEGLPSASVSAIYIDGDGVAWVGTRRGLVRIRDGQVRTFGAQHGLPANYFYQIVEDDLEHLWLSHGRGLVRVARRGLNDIADGHARTVDVRSFGTESGMKSTAMTVPNQPAVSKGRDGRLWFATGAGLAVVDPAAIVRNRVPPPVRVEEIRVDKKTYIPEEGAVYPPGSGDVDLHYVGLSFVAPERVRFKYKLEGRDGEWVEADTRRTAYYTNLPPGDYTFRVLACNNDGVWNTAGQTLRFRLAPHWYQRGSTHAAGVALLGLMLAGAHRWRVHQHKRRADELAKKVEEALSQVKVLRGMLPVCAGCKKIRDDSGYWNQMESYISSHSDADFSHGMCPDCIERLYPEYAGVLKKA